jgi:hypothetical protein
MVTDNDKTKVTVRGLKDFLFIDEWVTPSKTDITSVRVAFYEMFVATANEVYIMYFRKGLPKLHDLNYENLGLNDEA